MTAGQTAGGEERNGASPTGARNWVLFALALAAVIAYVQRASLGVLAIEARSELRLSKDQFGLVFSGFFLGYAWLQIPAGLWGDRWGSRRMLATYSALWSLAVALMARGNSLAALVLFWTLCGALQAGVFPCAMIVVNRWLPCRRWAFASGVLASSMSLGGALSTVVAAALLQVMSWRGVLLVLAVPGLVWAALFYLLFRDRPETHPAVNAAELALIRAGTTFASRGAEEPPPTRPVVPWQLIFSSAATWAICGQQFFRAAAYAFFQYWGPTYLRETWQTTTEAAGGLNSLIMLAVVAGAPLGGLISDHIVRKTGSRRRGRKGVAALSMLASALFIVLTPLADALWIAVALVCGATFFQALGGTNSYAITLDMGGEHKTTLFSLMNTCGNAGAAISPLLFGALAEWSESWTPVLILLGGVYLAAALCWAVLEPEGTIFDRAAPGG